jgi:DNA-binding transcriptional LysR family regulator
MDYFAALRAFVHAVDLGSFSKAAAEEGAKVSTVSRYVSALEADLGVALLNRSTRKLNLTEAGSTLYSHAVQVLAGLEDARTETASFNLSPRGLLRLNMPAAFGRLHVMPHLPDFLAAYPDIQLDVVLTDATVDLIDAGADVAIRIGALADSSLIARRLAPQQRLLVASPGYLRDSPVLEQPDDLAHHACLPFALQPTPGWYFRLKGDNADPICVKVQGRLRANDSEAIRGAALAGLGVALLPSWLVGQDIRDNRLVRLLPGWECSIALGPARAIWGVYPPKRVVSPKVKVFLDFVQKRFGNPAYWDRVSESPVHPVPAVSSF